MGNNAATWIGAVAAFLTALGIITRFLHLGELRRGTLNLVRDWHGDPPRPGYDGRPSFPERMTRVEHAAEATEKRTAALNHEMRGEMMSRLTLVEEALGAVEAATQQLQRNGGSSVADKVHDVARMMEDVTQAVDRLEVTAQQNRDGINDLSRRVTDMDEKVDAQGERITDHRRRNEQTVAELRAYLEQDRDDLLVAKQALEASVTELLNIDDER